MGRFCPTLIPSYVFPKHGGSSSRGVTVSTSSMDDGNEESDVCAPDWSSSTHTTGRYMPHGGTANKTTTAAVRAYCSYESEHFMRSVTTYCYDAPHFYPSIIIVYTIRSISASCSILKYSNIRYLVVRGWKGPVYGLSNPTLLGDGQNKSRRPPKSTKCSQHSYAGTLATLLFWYFALLPWCRRAGLPEIAFSAPISHTR